MSDDDRRRGAYAPPPDVKPEDIQLEADPDKPRRGRRSGGGGGGGKRGGGGGGKRDMDLERGPDRDIEPFDLDDDDDEKGDKPRRRRRRRRGGRGKTSTVDD